MIPLRSETDLSPPALHPCRHLSYAVHPLVLTITNSAGEKTNKHQIVKRKCQLCLLLSRLQDLCVCAWQGHLQSAASLLVKHRGWRRKSKRKGACLHCITWTDPPPRWRKSSCPLLSTSSHTNVSFSTNIYHSVGMFSVHSAFPSQLCISFLSFFIVPTSTVPVSGPWTVMSFQWNETNEDYFCCVCVWFSFNPQIASALTITVNQWFRKPGN